MPRPSRPWFRFYVEAVHDPKLRRMKPEIRWLWVAVLSAARESPIPGWLSLNETYLGYTAADLADYAAMREKDVEAGLEQFLRMGILMFDPNVSCWYVPKWDDRQFDSDKVTERTRKHRSNVDRRNSPTSTSGTPPESEAKSESERVTSESEDRAVKPNRGSPRWSGPDDQDRAYIAEHNPGIDAGLVFEKWANHCNARGLAFTDPRSEFRKWALNERSDAKPEPSRVPVERVFCEACGSSTGWAEDADGNAIPCPVCNPKAVTA